MQSLLQYRRIGRHLESRLSQHRDKGVLQSLGIVETHDEQHGHLFVVDFEDDHDPYNPKDYSIARKLATTGIVGCTGLLVGWASAIDSTATPQARASFHVSELVEDLATALYLIAFGLGSLVSGPLSETVGRNPVYIVSLLVFMIWTMASGLAPNIAAQLVFRFLAGLFGCTPLTTFGGSTSDMWNGLHRTVVFPVMACLSFLGPFLAPMSNLISWRWTEWTTLIMAGLVTGAIFLFAQETYPPVLLSWKASHLRKITGDDRFVSKTALKSEKFLHRMKNSIVRPFKLFFTQPIVVLWCLYLSLVYIILFTFLPGYNYIFADNYGFDQGTTGLMFIGLNAGFLLALAICPLIYGRYKRQYETLEGRVPPEERLIYAIIAAPCLPISLFWMGWTARPDISYWSPLLASVLFGFSMQGIFISAYLYLIDTFESVAASALVSLTLTRYVGAGAMTIAANPMYQGIKVEWTLTLLACLALLCLPIPMFFYRFGARIRKSTAQKGR
nr:putative efflux pump kojt [Quercus suber]